MLQAQIQFLKQAIEVNCSEFDASVFIPMLERGRVYQLISINLHDYQSLFCFEISYFNPIEETGEDFLEFCWIYQEGMPYMKGYIVVAPTVSSLVTELEKLENRKTTEVDVLCYDYPGSQLVRDFKNQLTKNTLWHHLLPASQTAVVSQQ